MAVVLVRKTGVTTYTAVFAWNPNPASEAVTHYTLWRSLSADMSGAAQVGGSITATTYSDTAAVSGYYYAVKAVNASGSSGYSDIELFSGQTMYHKAHNPYIHTISVLFGLSGATEVDMLKWDIHWGGKESIYDTYRALTKASDPNVKFLYYWNFNNVTDGDELDALIDAELVPDQYYVNAVGECTQTIDGYVFIRPDGYRFYSYRAANNPSGGVGGRWFVDYTSEANRTFLVNAMPALPANMDGYAIDNWGPCGAKTGELAVGTAGFEFGNKSAVYNLVYPNQELEIEHRKLMTAAIAAKFPNVVLLANVAAYSPAYASATSTWRDFTATPEVVNDVTLTYNVCNTAIESGGWATEKLWNLTQSNRSLYADFAKHYTIASELYQAACNKRSVSRLPNWVFGSSFDSSSNVTEIPAKSPRQQLAYLGIHLIFQFAGSYMSYMQDADNDDIQAQYFGAMGAKIGVPTGSATSIDSRTYKREFSNGIVVVRFRTSLTDDYTSSASYPLGGSYYEVDRDGNTSGPVTTTTLANMQGFIGLKNV